MSPSPPCFDAGDDSVGCATQPTPQDVADAQMLKRRPRTSTNPKTIQATKLRAQKRLASRAKETGDDKLIDAALTFKCGQATFPKVYARLHALTDKEVR